MTKPKKLPDAEAILGYLPDVDELTMLADCCPRYRWRHRQGVLRGYFFEKSIDAILDQRFLADGKKREELSQNSINRYKGWAHTKVRRALIRLLYMRYCQNDKLTPTEANGKIIREHVPAIYGKEQVDDTTITRFTSHVDFSNLDK